MASFPSLPLFVREFLADTIHLSIVEAGAYLHLLMHSWNRANCSVPDDDKKLAAWCKLSVSEWLDVRAELEPFFTIKNGQWTQKRLLKEFQYVKNLTNKRKEAGKKGGQAKVLNNKETPSSKAKAKGKQNPSKAVAPTLTPTPKKKDIDKSISKEKPKIENWEPSELHFATGLEEQYTTDEVTWLSKGFKDYAPTRKPAYKNLDLGFNNWLRSSISHQNVDQRRKSNGGQSGDQGYHQSASEIGAAMDARKSEQPQTDWLQDDGGQRTDLSDDGPYIEHDDPGNWG